MMECLHALVSGEVHGNGASHAGSHLKRQKVQGLVRLGLGLAFVPSLLLGCGGGGSAESPAASAPQAPAASTANVLFKSNFGPGVSLGAPYNFSTHGAYQDLTGTDSETGYTWPVTALGANFSGVQLIAPVAITPSTIGNYTRAELRTVSGPTGSRESELFLNTVDNGGVGNSRSAQTDFLIGRPWNRGDVTNLYTTFWVKFPANLATTLDPDVSSGNWQALTEFKTGGATHPVTGLRYGGGDYRIKVIILKNNAGELYWLTKADDAANWVIVNSFGAVVECPGSPECPSLQTYWRVENHDIPVPVGTWAKVEVYWHRSSGADGRYWAAVNGQVIADYHGSTMGDLGLPITRIFSTLAYSGGLPPNETHTRGLEFWDGFPCGVGRSCY